MGVPKLVVKRVVGYFGSGAIAVYSSDYLLRQVSPGFQPDSDLIQIGFAVGLTAGAAGVLGWQLVANSDVWHQTRMNMHKNKVIFRSVKEAFQEKWPRIKYTALKYGLAVIGISAIACASSYYFEPNLAQFLNERIFIPNKLSVALGFGVSHSYIASRLVADYVKWLRED